MCVGGLKNIKIKFKKRTIPSTKRRSTKNKKFSSQNTEETELELSS